MQTLDFLPLSLLYLPTQSNAPYCLHSTTLLVWMHKRQRLPMSYTHDNKINIIIVPIALSQQHYLHLEMVLPILICKYPNSWVTCSPPRCCRHSLLSLLSPSTPAFVHNSSNYFAQLCHLHVHKQ